VLSPLDEAEGDVTGGPLSLGGSGLSLDEAEGDVTGGPLSLGGSGLSSGATGVAARPGGPVRGFRFLAARRAFRRSSSTRTVR